MGRKIYGLFLWMISFESKSTHRGYRWLAPFIFSVVWDSHLPNSQ
jgi:hypothetical protein